jgi:putative transposase
MPQSFASLHVHLIFSTKHREPLLTPDILPRVFSYLGGIARVDGNVLVAAGGTPDHVHLLVSLNRQSSVADAVRSIKAESSKWVHKTFSNLVVRQA